MIGLGFDTSHWNYPADWGKALYRIREAYPNYYPFLIVKVSEGQTKYNDGLLAATNARSDGWDAIGSYHFYDRRTSAIKNAETYLSQWDKFDWTIIPSLDNELTSYMPAPGPVTYPGIMHAYWKIVTDVTKTGGIIYTNVSFAGLYLGDPSLQRYGLWLSQVSGNPKVSMGGPTVPLPWLKYVIWQKTFKNGLGPYFGFGSKDIDVDECSDMDHILIR